jgi:hypothetical protein
MVALVTHYHRQLRLGREALSPKARLGSANPSALPTCLESNLALAEPSPA